MSIIVTNLDDFYLRAAAGETKFLGANAVVTTTSQISELSVYFSIERSQSPDDHIAIDLTQNVVLSNALDVNSVVTVGGTAIGKIAYSGLDGLRFEFTTSATTARIEDLIHALTYTNGRGDNSIVDQNVIDVSMMNVGGDFSSNEIIATIAPASAIVLTSAVENTPSTAGADVLVVDDHSLNAGDTIDGGGGTDTLVLAGGKFFHLNELTTFAHVAILEGRSDLGDFGGQKIFLKATQLADIMTISGGASDEDGLIITSNPADAIDFRGKDIDGIEQIFFVTENIDVTFNDRDAALLAYATGGGDNHLTLEGASFTAEQKALLHQHGIDRITDGSGGPDDIDLPPGLTAIDGDKISVSSTQSTTFLDAGRNMAITNEDDLLLFLDIQVVGGNDARDHLAINTTGGIVLSNGMEDGSRIFVDGVEIGTITFGTASNAGGHDVHIALTGGDLHQVAKLVSAITYSSASADWSPNESRQVRISVTDSGYRQTDAFVTVQHANEAPTNITLSAASVSELAATDTAVGSLSAQDANSGDVLTFSLSDSAGGRFAIKDNKIVVADGVKLDYEQAKSHTIKVKATDKAGTTFEKIFSIGVLDLATETTAGSAGNDVIVGGLRKDNLSGGLLDDVLNGGLGNDILKGGSGKDLFVFNTKLGKTNVDKIVDFNVKDDSIHLDDAIFRKLGKGSPTKPTKLNKAFFTIGAAKDKNDYVLYDKTKGVLSYDIDGSGSAKAVAFATISKTLKMTALDFFLI